MSRFELLDKDTWKAYYEGGVSVLVVGKSTCNACKEWGEELEAFLENGEEYPDIRFGKVLIDKGGMTEWKKASPWLADVTDLPCTVIIDDGEVKKQFYGKGVDRLKNRLDKVLADADGDDGDGGGCGCGCG